MTDQNNEGKSELPVVSMIRASVERKPACKRVAMSLTGNKTGQLWASFMPDCKFITNALNSDLIAMQAYFGFLYGVNHFYFLVIWSLNK